MALATVSLVHSILWPSASSTPKMRFRVAPRSPSIRRMKRTLPPPSGLWRGVRMRTTQAASDPDADPRQVSLPASWDDAAADALAGLVPGTGMASLAAAADAWIAPIEARARDAGLEADIGARLHALLLARRGAPAASVWRGASAGGTRLRAEPRRVPRPVSRFRCRRLRAGRRDRDAGAGAAGAQRGAALRRHGRSRGPARRARPAL